MHLGGRRRALPPLQPGSAWVLKFLFQGINFFFQGLVGVKPLNFFSRGCKFFSRAYPPKLPQLFLDEEKGKKASYWTSDRTQKTPQKYGDGVNFLMGCPVYYDP